MGSLGHVISAAFAAILGMLLVATMTDGRSVVTAQGGTGTLGVGVLYDSQGRGWNHGSHVVSACDDLVRLGKTVLAFVLMATVFAYFAMGSSLMGLHTGKGVFGLVSVALHAANAVFLLIAMSAGAALYNKEYCGFKVKDITDLGYAIPLLVVGIVVSLLCVGALLATGAMRDAAPAGSAPKEHANQAEPEVRVSEPAAEVPEPTKEAA